MRPADLLLPFAIAASPAAAQAPLSAIDWLREPPPVTVAQPLVRPLGQPPANGAVVPQVAVTTLERATPDAAGLLPPATTGLPRDLWAASSSDTIVAQFDRLGGRPLPAMQALYYTLLLAEADPPADAADDARFLHARIAALRRFGAVDAALALVEGAGPETPALFDDWLDLALLAGTEDAPCRALAARPDLSPSYAARVFCTARSGDWATAALTYDAATALKVLSPHEAALLGGFLDPEMAEAPVDLPPPRKMTPLIFRLYEAAGNPLPTGNLPREYAVSDLRGTMGWKAEIEAAERLARTGALPANRLLGIYTDREPAASGGVWDRVRAIHDIDAAVQAGDAAAIAAALPGAWTVMRQSGLAVAFAALYGPRLAANDLPPRAAALAYEVALLAPADTTPVAPPLPGQARRLLFLDTLARGAPDASLAATPAERAIAAAFAADAPAADHAAPLAEGRLGQTILTAAAQLQDIRPGQSRQLQGALATLRAVGLTEVAREAALQILLLGERA